MTGYFEKTADRGASERASEPRARIGAGGYGEVSPELSAKAETERAVEAARARACGKSEGQSPSDKNLVSHEGVGWPGSCQDDAVAAWRERCGAARDRCPKGSLARPPYQKCRVEEQRASFDR